jgi:methionyl-tRNA formyltransferase
VKLAYFANGTLGCQVFDQLLTWGQLPVVMILNAPAKQRQGNALRERAQRHGIPVLEAQNLTEEHLAAYAPTRGLSVLYGHILRPPMLALFEGGITNLHTSLLPANRGANPNVWPLVDGSPAGVTLHQIDAGVDTGPIYAQRAVPVTPDDDAKTLYERLQHAIYELFCEVWPVIVAGSLKPQPQCGTATEHRKADFEALRQLDLDAQVRTGALIDRLRACSFTPYPGAFFDHEGQRYALRVQIERLDDPDN